MASKEHGGQPRVEVSLKLKAIRRAILASSLGLAGCPTLMDLSSPSITNCVARFPIRKLEDGKWAEVTNQSQGECRTRSTRFGWDQTPATKLTTEPLPYPKPQPDSIIIPKGTVPWTTEGETDFHEPQDVVPGKKNNGVIGPYIPPEFR